MLDDPEDRGRVFELAVGARLLQLPGELYYWRENNLEVDFVFRSRKALYAIEVKSGQAQIGKRFGGISEKVPGSSACNYYHRKFSAVF